MGLSLVTTSYPSREVGVGTRHALSRGMQQPKASYARRVTKSFEAVSSSPQRDAHSSPPASHVHLEKLAREHRATETFEAVSSSPREDAPPSPPELLERLEKLEREQKGTADFLGVLAEHIVALESANARLREELLILRASRARTSGVPYNSITPREETIAPPPPSCSRTIWSTAMMGRSDRDPTVGPRVALR